MDRAEVLSLINVVLTKNGRSPVEDSDTPLREAGLRSLDFAEVALRMEDKLGRELKFGAVVSRVRTVADVIDYFAQAATSDAQPVE